MYMTYITYKYEGFELWIICPGLTQSQSCVFDDYPSSRTIGVSYITQEIPVMDLNIFFYYFVYNIVPDLLAKL